MKVLGLVGSARRKGNTDILVDEILKVVEKQGGDAEKVFLSSMTINPCRGCSTCERTGKCIHDDDLAALVEKMKRSDVWIFGTPVYFWGPTAQFKAFMDRWFGISKDVFKGKRVIIVMPLGDSDVYYARHAIGMVTDSCEYMGLKVFEKIIVPGVYEKGEVVKKPDIMNRTRDAAEKLFS